MYRRAMQSIGSFRPGDLGIVCVSPCNAIYKQLMILQGGVDGGPISLPLTGYSSVANANASLHPASNSLRSTNSETVWMLF
jgi:hypothetical protein